MTKLQHHKYAGRSMFIGSLLILLTFFHWCHNGIAGENNNHLYVTGKVMEIDRCASAWLIKRHIDARAVFDFLTDEELMVSQGISFDTPYSKFRRSHRASTFESIQQEYSLHGDRVDYLAKLIHEMEINFWNKNTKKETARFQFELEKILQDAPDIPAALKSCFEYLDNFSIPN
jgi:hypothetical protein